MSRKFPGAITDYLSAGRAAVTGYPLTLVGWARVAQPTLAKGYLFGLYRSTTTNDVFGIYAYYDLVLGFRAGFQVRQSTTLGDAQVGLSGASDFPWILVIGIATSATSRDVYAALLGDKDFATASNTTNLTPAGINSTYMGAGKNGLSGAVVSPLNGIVAGCGLWNVTLNADERLRILRGADLASIRPDALRGLYDNSKSDSVEWDHSKLGGDISLVMTGAVPASADEPFYPVRIPAFHKVMPTVIAGKVVQLGPVQRFVFSYRDLMRGVLELLAPPNEPYEFVFEESTGVSDAMTALAAYIRTAADDLEDLTDDNTPSIGFIRTAGDDALGLTDNTSRTVGYRRTNANSEGLSDAMSRVAVFARTLAASLGLTDARTRTIAFVRVQTDAEGVGDTVQQGAIVILSDGLGISDTSSTVASFFFTRAEAEGLVDSVSRAAGYVRSLDNDEATADAVASALTVVVILAEALALHDSIGKILQIRRVFQGAVGDTVGLADTPDTAVAFLRSASDAEAVADIMAATVSFFSTLNNAEGISDANTTARVFVRVQSDAEGLTDALSRLASYIQTIANALGVSDARDVLKTYQRTVANALGLTDAASRAAAFVKLFNDPEGIADALGGGALYSLVQTESVALSDTITRTLSYLRTLVNDMPITDVITRAIDFARALAELEGLTDVEMAQLNRDLVSILFRLSIGAVIDNTVSQTGMFENELTGSEILTNEVQ